MAFSHKIIWMRPVAFGEAFVCPNVPGHLNPMTRLGRGLQARNHEVVFLHSSSASGLPCVPGPEKDHIHENRGQTSKMQGEDALEFGLRLVMNQTEAILKSFEHGHKSVVITREVFR